MNSEYYEEKLMEETSNDNIDIDAYRMMLRDFEIMEQTLKEITNAAYDHEPDNWTVDLASTILYNIKNCNYGEGKTFPIDKIGESIYDNLIKKDKEKDH